MRGGGGPEPGSRFRRPQPLRLWPPPLLAAPSLRRLAFHLRIFHAGLAWRRAVCGPHKGRRVLHSSRWGPAGEGPAAWRGARLARGGAAPAEAWPAPCRQGPLPRQTQPREFHIHKHTFKSKTKQKHQRHLLSLSKSAESFRTRSPEVP